ncbi:hypothetical protein V6X62_08235 [Spiribacter sp. 218]|uniref:hypothetical protein n=1 Tax=Spiribacter pallidus TaxID=1987936 RepID=UPI00349F85A1
MKKGGVHRNRWLRWFSILATGGLVLSLMAGCAAPGAQRHLGDDAFDDVLTGHRYLGPVEEQSIERIGFQRLPSATYRLTHSGEVQAEQVLERWAVGATIRETRTLIFDEFRLELSLNRGLTGRVYGVELKALELKSGEPVSPEMRREAQELATGLLAADFAYERSVLGKPLSVGQLIPWEVPDNFGALLQDVYVDESTANEINVGDLSIEGASRYLGVTQTTYGEAAVFREYGRSEIVVDGARHVVRGAGWRLIDRRTGALIERDMRTKVDYGLGESVEPVYLNERLERIK